MFKKLKIKFVATSMILLTSIVILIFTSIYIGMNKNGEYMMFSRIGETLNSLKVGQNGELSARGRYENNSIIVVYDVKSSRLMYKSFYEIDEKKIIDIAEEVLDKNIEKGFIKEGDYSFAYMYRNSPMGIEMVLQDSSMHNNTMQKLIITSIIIGTISLGLLFGVSIFISNKAIKPVEAAYNSQKRFIADASHELKTPLAVIKTNLELLNSNEENSIRSQKKWIDYISFQTERMSKLVNNLLYLAKADNNEELGVKTRFNISDVVMNQLLTFEAVVFENKLSLNCDLDPDIYVNGDREGINQLVGIFMDNAVKHAYKNTEINVELKEKKQGIYLAVGNEGETIPEEDMNKIFDRFYRVDEARDREKGGYGLGLSIAKSIVDKYKGEISVKSENNYTIFIAELRDIDGKD